MLVRPLSSALVTAIGIVSPGAMGSAVGAAYARAGTRALATVAGRSQRTEALAAEAGLELVRDLDAVVAAADVVLSIVPPGEATATAEAIAAAARRAGAAPLVADWNAISPATVRSIAEALGEAGLDFVDGSISGGPPRAGSRTRVYLSGARAEEIAAAAPAEIDARVVGSDIGLASAVKMCTAAMYKGSTALLAHSLLTARANGVLEHVLDDLQDSFARELDRAARSLAVSATKAERFVAEMREIAATQAAAGLTPAVFDGFAEAYTAIASSAVGREAPESIPAAPSLDDVLERLAPERAVDAGERT
jgi:3-hydroxyisobutyrate dehydrogenase-like beta-hydroxyacid dehydrogenase